MNDIFVIDHDDFDSCLTACMHPYFTFKADNNGVIEEINRRHNFINNLFEWTNANQSTIQFQEDGHDK